MNRYNEFKSLKSKDDYNRFWVSYGLDELAFIYSQFEAENLSIVKDYLGKDINYFIENGFEYPLKNKFNNNLNSFLRYCANPNRIDDILALVNVSDYKYALFAYKVLTNNDFVPRDRQWFVEHKLIHLYILFNESSEVISVAKDYGDIVHVSKVYDEDKLIVNIDELTGYFGLEENKMITDKFLDKVYMKRLLEKLFGDKYLYFINKELGRPVSYSVGKDYMISLLDNEDSVKDLFIEISKLVTDTKDLNAGFLKDNYIFIPEEVFGSFKEFKSSYLNFLETGEVVLKRDTMLDLKSEFIKLFSSSTLKRLGVNSEDRLEVILGIVEETCKDYRERIREMVEE